MHFSRRDALQLLTTAGVAGVAAVSSPAATQDPLPLPLEPGFGRMPGHGVSGRMTGAQAAVATLCAHGVGCVYGVPGAQNNEFWDALKSHGVPYLLVSNEFSASIMADAAARVSGHVGVFSVIPGPGLTNALTGIGEALHDSVPIVGLVTDIDRSPHAPIGQVHGLANAALLRPVCKAVFEANDVTQIPHLIQRAFHAARCGEPGPAVVLIPYPLLMQTAHFSVSPPLPLTAPFDEAAYRRALALLTDRRCRVGIYAGQGTFGASDALLQVAQLLQAPVATSVSGKGAIPETHPLSVGWGYGPYGTRTAERAFRDVDIVLALGVRFSEVSTANYNIPEHNALIHVDINPHNIGRNVKTTVPVCADAGHFLNRLLQDGGAIQRPVQHALHQRIQGEKAEERRANARVQVRGCVDPMLFFLQLQEHLGCDGWLFVDVTTSVHWASEAIVAHGPRRYFTPSNNQSMGWAVPAAVGAQRLAPYRRVISVTGDGCFLMSGLEASTAAREHLPVKFFVFDDGAYHYMQMLQKPAYGRTTATQIARLHYPALAHGMGLAFNHIASNEELACGISRAMHMPGPVLTQVDISYDGRELRWLSALKDSYLDKLNTRQKVQIARRRVARRFDPTPEND